MTHYRTRNMVTGFACLLLIAILPILLSEVKLNMAIEMAYFSLFAVSYNLLLGYGGTLSFGHAAYFGTGAYFMVFSLKYVSGMPILLAILIAGVAAGRQ